MQTETRHRWRLGCVFGLLVLLLAAPAFARPNEECARALLSQDVTDSVASRRAHFSHQSVWEARDRFYGNLRAPQVWHKYLQTRYGKWRERQTDHAQWAEWDARIKAAAAGGFGELGELQIAEKYLSDPEVQAVEFLLAGRVENRRTPDLRVHFVRGGSKLVEVKTRTPGYFPDWDHIATRLPSADDQVRSFKSMMPGTEELRADLEIVYHYPHKHLLSKEQIEDLVHVAEFEFEETTHLGRMTLNLNNRPYLQLTHYWDGAAWQTRTEFLRKP